MDIEECDAKPHVFGKESAKVNLFYKNISKKTFKIFSFHIKKHKLADAWVVKSSEITTSGQQFHVKTHLGYLLNIGDSALGFDFANANINDENLDSIKPENLPDVVSY